MSKVEEPQGEYRRIPKKVSLEMYLEMIADGTRRLEYHDGEIVDIKSATDAHGTIIMNISVFLGTCLLNKDCKLYTQDRELWVAACKKVYYPDLLMVCGEHIKKQMSDKVEATLNPSTVIEVLSDSTEKYDLYTKSKCYKSIESLKQIVFVRQDMKYVMVQKKSNNNEDWIISDFTEDEEVVKIGDCTILLSDFYRKVEFQNAPNQKSDYDNYAL